MAVITHPTSCSIYLSHLLNAGGNISYLFPNFSFLRTSWAVLEALINQPWKEWISTEPFFFVCVRVCVFEVAPKVDVDILNRCSKIWQVHFHRKTAFVTVWLRQRSCVIQAVCRSDQTCVGLLGGNRPVWGWGTVGVRTFSFCQVAQVEFCDACGQLWLGR